MKETETGETMVGQGETWRGDNEAGQIRVMR